MINLIKGEIYKLTRSVVFRNSSILMAFMSLWIIFVRYIMSDGSVNFMLTYMENRAYGFTIQGTPMSFIEYFYSALGGIAIVLILSIFIVGASVVNEFISGTIKNPIAYGHSRITMYFSKVIGAAFVVSIFTTIFIVVTTIISTLINGVGDGFTSSLIIESINIILLINIILACVVSIYICLAFIIKSKAILVVTLMGIIFITATQMSDSTSLFLKFNPFFMLMDVCAEIPSKELTLLYIRNSLLIIALTSTIGAIHFKNQDVK